MIWAPKPAAAEVTKFAVMVLCVWENSGRNVIDGMKSVSHRVHGLTKSIMKVRKLNTNPSSGPAFKQLAPFPRQNDFIPPSRYTNIAVCLKFTGFFFLSSTTWIVGCIFLFICTLPSWASTLIRSRGAVAVRETVPAIKPATREVNGLTLGFLASSSSFSSAVQTCFCFCLGSGSNDEEDDDDVVVEDIIVSE